MLGGAGLVWVAFVDMTRNSSVVSLVVSAVVRTEVPAELVRSRFQHFAFQKTKTDEARMPWDPKHHLRRIALFRLHRFCRNLCQE